LKQEMEGLMSATGLDVFDKTLQTTNIWLDELMADIGPDRQVAWHVLGAVLRTVRDRVPAGLAAHLGAQLPLLVRGAYYDGYRPSAEPLPIRDLDGFVAHVQEGLRDIRPVNGRDAVAAVFGLLGEHLTRGQCANVYDALPEEVRRLWRLDDGEPAPANEKAATGRAAQNAHDARVHQTRAAGPGRKTGSSHNHEEAAMRVSDAMTRDVHLARPDQTIQDAARLMLEIDAGVLPVGENDRLVGMITDRDIAVRAVAEGKSPATKVREVMSADVKYCFDDEDTEHVARNMGEQQVRRLPVVDRDKRLVGILALGDLAISQRPQPVGEALQDISRPGGEHSQTPA
jgi:uncharacterized protein (DUF2267 family)/CBS domain-containing protein